MKLFLLGFGSHLENIRLVKQSVSLPKKFSIPEDPLTTQGSFVLST